MYPATFDYRRASSVDDALSQLASETDRDVRPIAGGHGLLPAMKAGELAPDVLVDVGDCDELGAIEPADDGEGVVVGALATHADLLDSPVLADRVPLLAETAGAVGDVQIRNRGTIGGNLVEADPGADLPAALLALDATVRLRSPDDRRDVPAVDFFEGAGETVVADDELVTGIVVPGAGDGAYAKKTHPARGFAMVGVAAAVELADDAIADVRVGAVGATERPIRLSAVEDALTGAGVDEASGAPHDDGALADAAALVDDDLSAEPRRGDVHASAAFRARLLRTHVERATGAAIERANGGETE
ncbi:FAD binding domain-containing protein [Halovivax sp.]|uniref:FAD binding domain-containing protein n=1 Tax=Halovivax sp. TaxID=1935978 RepID=UPI0025C4F3AD|nr:FAD binding domain-containing protein [Halovivax sp.]